MLMIVCELAGKDRDTKPLETAIGAVGAATRAFRNVWLVDSLLSATAAYNLLESALDKNAGDRMLVIEANPENRQGWMPKPLWDFLGARAKA